MPTSTARKDEGSDTSTDSSNPPLTPADFGIAAKVPAQNDRVNCVRYTIGISFLVVVAVIGIGFAVSPNGIENPFEPIDPPGQTEANPWRSGSTGLDLVVENALEDHYDAMFDDYISRWNESPALSLRSIKVEHDPPCSETMGRLKVCNGNYGRTDWKGLALNFMRNGKTIWSTAKLNDFFLDSNGVNHQKYTMCHEVGHGVGLPHLDENYWNADSGDCMDYTLRPRNNLNPGQYSLDLLVEMYGSSRSSSRGGYLRHKQRALYSDDLQQNHAEAVPQNILSQYHQAVIDLHTADCPFGECHIDLGEGYEIHAHKLGV